MGLLGGLTGTDMVVWFAWWALSGLLVYCVEYILNAYVSYVINWLLRYNIVIMYVFICYFWVLCIFCILGITMGSMYLLYTRYTFGFCCNFLSNTHVR